MGYGFFAQRRAQKLFVEAQQLVRNKRFEVALPLLAHAIEQIPTASLYDYRGVVLSLARNNELALKSFAQALLRAETLQERARIYFHRCLLYGREQEYDLALRDIAQAVQLVPKNATYRKAHQHIAQACNDSCVDSTT